MKKALSLVVLLFFIGYSNAQDIRITLDTSPVERFLNLMSYIETLSEAGLKAKYGTAAELKEAYQKYSTDTRLKSLIDSLLTTHPYSHQYMHYVRVFNGLTGNGKEAYRKAFTVLADCCASMTADMPRTWVQVWNMPEREAMSQMLNEIRAEAPQIMGRIGERLLAILPRKGINWDMETKLYFTVDGNRGGYQEGNMVVMDLVTTEVLSADSQGFENTVAHELHHAYYCKWMMDNCFNGKKLTKLQQNLMSFVMEGTAQFLNFPSYPPRIKELYSNRDLMDELFTELVTMTYADKDMDENAWARLKKYIPDYTRDEIPNRPLMPYYVSYNLYRSVYECGGKEQLDYVLKNPGELLDVYNKLYDSEKMVTKKFPAEFVKMWRHCFNLK